MKKSFTFHLEQHEFTHSSLVLLTPTNGRPPFCHIGLLAEAGSSYLPYPPGRLQVVTPNGLTRGEKHRVERTTSEYAVVLSLAVCQYRQYLSSQIRRTAGSTWTVPKGKTSLELLKLQNYHLEGTITTIRPTCVKGQIMQTNSYLR